MVCAGGGEFAQAIVDMLRGVVVPVWFRVPAAEVLVSGAGQSRE